MPNPLPPPLIWSPALASALSSADQALGRLDGMGRTLSNPHLLIDPFIRREAVLSSRIEGTQASLSDLFLFEAVSSIERRVPDVREVWNYVQAMEYGRSRQSDLPLSLRLLREVHKRLMAGVRGAHRMPGDFRRIQNWIGPPGCSAVEATFVPPPPREMRECLAAFEKYLHAPSDLPSLVRLAMIHYQLEAIHPFVDGNGRIGRLLITLLLLNEKLLSQPLLYLSAYFENHREEYYRRLLRVSQAGEWTPWIVFFLRGVAEQAADGVERANRLQTLNQQYREGLQKARASALPLRLLDGLSSSPVTTASRAAALLGVTAAAAQGCINKLVGQGILREVSGRRRGRIYCADGIIEVVGGAVRARSRPARGFPRF